jgi:cellulose synthase/poly-beta-1,6-N-acetylglucosamine synthase-like glycosyltransferase
MENYFFWCNKTSLLIQMNLFYVLAVCILVILNIWAFYNAPILLVGVKKQVKEGRRHKQVLKLHEKLPFVSIIVPVKDEERVIGRLLETLLTIGYQLERMEIIIAEDGSKDCTEEICREYASRYPKQIQLIQQAVSTGKPSALNLGLQHAKGEIVGVFDADSIPKNDAILKAVTYFEDASIAAVQGRNISINASRSILAKIVSLEETMAFQLHLQGRDALKMFVPLTGSCYFIRKSVIKQIGGWDAEALTEDLEMSVRLSLNGHRTKYAADLQAHYESVAKIKQLVIQRLRWFRGSMEVGLKCGKLLTKPTRKNMDIELTLTGPFIFPLCFLGLITILYGFVFPVNSDPNLEIVLRLSLLPSLIVVLTSAVVLAFVAYQQEVRNFFWLPIVYCYWIFESFLATCALVQIALKRPRKWTKIKKTG